jgi:hypothetical protein
MGKMKELYVEQLREEESFKTLYPDQQDIMNNEQCLNCLSFNTVQIKTYTYDCQECGVTMVEIDNQLRLA